MRHCAEIETDEEASTRYGVKRKSLLTQLQYFNICSGALIPDVMHDVLEGVLQYEAKLVLSHITSGCHYISLSRVNHLLECIELGYMEVCNRPSAVVLNMDDKHLKQNGMGGLYNTVVSRVWRLLHCPLEVWYMYMGAYPGHYGRMHTSIIWMCLSFCTCV